MVKELHVQRGQGQGREAWEECAMQSQSTQICREQLALQSRNQVGNEEKIGVGAGKQNPEIKVEGLIVFRVQEVNLVGYNRMVLSGSVVGKT